MITNFNKYKLIKETPDGVDFNGDRLRYWYNDARAFFVTVNPNHSRVLKLHISSKSATHGDIYTNDYKSYAGRIWTDHKLITFWVYPNEGLFKQIIKALEDKLHIKIFNNGWSIEIMKLDDEIKKREFDPDDEDDFYFGSRENRSNDESKLNQEIISIEQYVGSEDVPEEEHIMHMMNWEQKQKAIKAGKFDNEEFGSYRMGWDQPKNIKYRQKIYQEKNDNKI